MPWDKPYQLSLAKSATELEVNGAYGVWKSSGEVQTNPRGQVYVTWHLQNEKMKAQYGGTLYVKVTFNDSRGMSYAVHGPESPKALATGGGWQDIFNGDLDHDLEKLSSLLDGTIQVTEDPEFSSMSILTRFLQDFDRQEPQYKGEKPEKVPLSSMFPDKEPSSIPEEPPQAPAKKDWRTAESPEEIISLFPHKPTADDVLDLHQKAQSLKSNKLMNYARRASTRVESTITRKAKNLVDSIMARVRRQSGIVQLESYLTKQTKPSRKKYLEDLLARAKKAESLNEGKKHRVILFKPCDECKQEESKIEECARCRGCGIDPDFQVRIFEDPRNHIHEILPARHLPSRPG